MLLNGPNLNLLGSREPEIYGSVTLEEIEKKLDSKASASGQELICYQSNAEHDLVEQIHLHTPSHTYWDHEVPTPLD